MAPIRYALALFAILSSGAWAQTSAESPGWPAQASQTGTSPSQISRFDPQYYRSQEHGDYRIRLWEFRFANDQAPLVKNGSIELDFGGNGLSLRALF